MANLPPLQGPVSATPSGHGAPVTMRAFDDHAATREAIYSKTLKALEKLPPVENARHSLRVERPAYAGPGMVSLAEQNRAILEGRSLFRRLKGDVVLTDKATGKELDRKNVTIAQVPMYTQRGTFIFNGSENGLSHQLRLQSGIYARIRSTGEAESHVNVRPGKGLSHRYFLDPETGLFKLQAGQASVPLVTVLRAMGATDRELQEAWGRELFSVNAKKDDPRSIEKLYEKLERRPDKQAPAEGKRLRVAELMAKMELDPEVTKRTLGHPHATLSKETILAATRKLLRVARDEEEPDDRDHLAYQTFHGPEDMIAERAERSSPLFHQLLWKATRTGKLDHVQPNFLSKHVQGAILDSGIGNNLEEINPLEFLNNAHKITRMGRGGIASIDSIPSSSRAVHSSHVGFIDLVSTPESQRAGVDTRAGFKALKGDDGRLYTPVHNARTGKEELKSPQDLADAVLAFPGQMQTGKKRVTALVKGRATSVPREEVDYALPHMEHAFTPTSNLVPLKAMSKGQRVSMGGRFLVQSVALKDGEAPLVQGLVPGTNKSFEELYGRHAGAVHARDDQGGRVVKVTPDGITVKYDDGKTEEHELYNHFVLNRKSLLHNTPVVREGDRIEAGRPLAKSNYTDAQGRVAVGKNLRTAYIAHGGGSSANYEDAWVISESAAKKFTSDHAYQHAIEWEDNHKRGKRTYQALFPTKYDRKTLELLDEDGVIKPGTKVESGTPLVLAASQKDPDRKTVHQSRGGGFSDASLVWDHHAPGEVVSVAKTDKGVNVVVRSFNTTEIADKLCYDPETEVLTSRGWARVAELTTADEVATLGPEDRIEYLQPVGIHRYHHIGRMYRLETTQIDLLVTENHHLYACRRNRSEYSLQTASELFGKTFRLKRDGVWTGASPDFVKMPDLVVKAGQFGHGERALDGPSLPTDVFVMLLGMYLSEGCTFNQPSYGSYGIDITQINPGGRAKLFPALDAAGLKYNATSNGARIYSKSLMAYFNQFGRAKDKFIPEEVFFWATEHLKSLYYWLMWGDGCEGGTGHSYCTTSPRLADDFQRLLLHIGMSGNIKRVEARRGVIKGKEYDFAPRYDVSVFRSKNRPEINHGHWKTQNGQREAWEEYSGEVFCPQMPKNHVIYVRRNGKPVWCGNSGLYGDKGVISGIMKDDEMPHDENGKPFEMLANPLGVISRINASQVAAAVLGKIAQKTGQPYKVEDFPHDKEDITGWVQQEAKKHGVKDLETVIDPVTGKRIPNVLTGVRYYMKLHHSAEGKASARGLGAYDAEGTPARGPGEAAQAKRLALMETNALLSHSALDVLKDARLVRGNQNVELWASYMGGDHPSTPPVPFVFQKFVNQLKAAGVNVTRKGAQTRITALTDKDIDELAGDRELGNAETVHWGEDMRPVKGGLFDEQLTGGHTGQKWVKLVLAEPMLNPVMEEPARRLLGLTQAQLESVIKGERELQGKKGPEAISHALASINLEKGISRARADIASGRKTLRDDAVKRLSYLKAAQSTGVHPGDWVLKAAPVLPPIFRPVSVMQGTGGTLIADANVLYRDLFESNQVLKGLKGQVDDTGAEMLSVYNALKAVQGLGDPVNAKTQEKKVKGLLDTVFGSSSKHSVVQSRLIGTPVNNVGRGVVIPDADLDMDEVGIPEAHAWKVYEPSLIRSLVRRGMGRVDALAHVRDKSDVARQALLAETEKGPILMTRAPVLHRFGILALLPRLVKGDAVKVNPYIVAGQGMDFDGDAVNYHLPLTQEAKQEAMEKMLPSKSLLAVSDLHTPMFNVRQEFQAGLYRMTHAENKEKRARTFATMKDLHKAYLRGEIEADDPVTVMDHGGQSGAK